MRFIHKLSNIGPSSGWCAGECRFTVARQSEIRTVGFLCLQTETEFSWLLCIFSFRSALSCVWWFYCYGVSNQRHLPPLLCCVQNVGGAFGSCYASIRALEVSSVALTTEFVLCVCKCVLFVCAWATRCRAWSVLDQHSIESSNHLFPPP